MEKTRKQGLVDIFSNPLDARLGSTKMSFFLVRAPPPFSFRSSAVSFLIDITGSRARLCESKGGLGRGPPTRTGLKRSASTPRASERRQEKSFTSEIFVGQPRQDDVEPGSQLSSKLCKWAPGPPMQDKKSARA